MKSKFVYTEPNEQYREWLKTNPIKKLTPSYEKKLDDEIRKKISDELNVTGRKSYIFSVSIFTDISLTFSFHRIEDETGYKHPPPELEKHTSVPLGIVLRFIGNVIVLSPFEITPCPKTN
jgi:hypothetical protein